MPTASRWLLRVAVLWAWGAVVLTVAAHLWHGGLRAMVRNDSGRDLDCELPVARGGVTRFVLAGETATAFLQPEGDTGVTLVARADGRDFATASQGYFSVSESDGDADFVVHRDGRVAASVVTSDRRRFKLSREDWPPVLLWFLLPVCAATGLRGLTSRRRPGPRTAAPGPVG